MSYQPGPNLYEYASSRPAVLTDPTGLAPNPHGAYGALKFALMAGVLVGWNDAAEILFSGHLASKHAAAAVKSNPKLDQNQLRHCLWMCYAVLALQTGPEDVLHTPISAAQEAYRVGRLYEMYYAGVDTVEELDEESMIDLANDQAGIRCGLESGSMQDCMECCSSTDEGYGHCRVGSKEEKAIKEAIKRRREWDRSRREENMRRRGEIPGSWH